MLASLLSPTSTTNNTPEPGRMSQLLPSVKCSTCHQPVPLAELGEHTCTAPPPVPTLPKPSITPAAATALLPAHLQGRVASPSAPSPPRQDPPQHQRMTSSASSIRLRINTRGPNSPTQPAFQMKPSPLSRPGPERENTSSPRPRDPFPSNGPTASPLNTRPPPGDPFRARTPSNAGSTQNTPATARPSISFNRDTTPVQTAPPPLRTGSPFVNTPIRGSSPTGQLPPPPAHALPPPRNGLPPPNAFPPPNRGPGVNGPPPGPPMMIPPRQGTPAMAPPNAVGPRAMRPVGGSVSMSPAGGVPPNMAMPPASSHQSFIPPAERGIDTKSGGEAGMAGVGRRGFAAAARAAMFVGPGDRPLGQQLQYNRRPNAPQFLDIDAAIRSASTPPLSAGSGYSSHSPGPTSPLAQSEFAPQPTQIQRTPSPSGPFISAPTQPLPPKPPSPAPPLATSINNMSMPSPITGRLPFFEKFKNKIPGLSPSEQAPPSNILTDDTNNNNDMATSNATRPRADTSESTFSRGRGGPTMPSRSMSSSTNASQRQRSRSANRPPSPNYSESEYSGLAYADSTDYEDDDALRKRKDSPPPLPPLKDNTPMSILRSGSNASASSRIQFGSVSGRSNRSQERRDDRTGIRVGHSRDGSASSYSSVSSVSGGRELGGGDISRPRSNSTAIAQALGLSQAPPSDYSKLGGPGIARRGGRSISGSSSGGRSAYSRTGAPGAPGAGEKAMDPVLEDADRRPGGLSKSNSTASGKQRAVGDGSDLRRMDTGSSKASSSRHRRDDDEQDDDAFLHRSNTVQGVVSSPDVKPIKLPMRSLTSPQLERDKALDGTRVKKERVKKIKVCLKCQKTIDNGRWVSVDNGGVLCEKCWKHMYLPKCRRCKLPIEKAAVSSSDGQLKGKYHRDCFNCHICHKPFPDRTFYVYDGRPLCAYHYHEANDSLCAAARCGQPIEGPCAVSHTGDRYHPEHMTCEYPGNPECRERLDEYWEVDGRMLCERHALTASKSGSDEEGEERWVKTSRAMKRVTRFIDLAGAGGLGAPAPSGGTKRDSLEESDLR